MCEAKLYISQCLLAHQTTYVLTSVCVPVPMKYDEFLFFLLLYTAWMEKWILTANIARGA